MKKSLFYTVLPAAVLLAGCSTVSPETATAPRPAQEIAPAQETAALAAPSELRSALLDEMGQTAAGIREAGGLASIGACQSKSLDLALNKAKVNGRIVLARMLADRFAALEKAFSEETGIPSDSLFLSGFNSAAKAIKEQQIAGSIAQSLKYETSGDTFTAYALMVLDPKTIADQLAQQKDLFARLQPTKAFAELDKEVKAYAAFKAAQK